MKLAALAILLLIIFAVTVRHYSTSQPHSSPAPEKEVTQEVSPGLKSLQDRMSREQARLDSLQTSLDGLNSQGTAEDAGSRLQEINQRIKDLEQRISQLAQEQRATAGNAENYQEDLQAQKASAAIGIELQVQDINNAIVDLQNQEAEIRNTPTVDPRAQTLQIQAIEAQIANQKATRDSLQSQRRSIAEATDMATAAGSQQVRMEATDILQEKRNLERELSDLRAEAQFWNQGGKDAASKAQRIQELQAEIAAQEETLAEIRNQYAQESERIFK